MSVLNKLRHNNPIMKIHLVSIALTLIAPAFSQDVLWPTTLGKYFSSNFGENRDDHFHMGLDIKTNGKIGMEVLAVEDGYISRIRSNYEGYGKSLYQRTNSGHEVVYGHLESFTPVMEKVWRLQQAKRRSYIVDTQFSSREFQVKKGDLIGYSGNTGNSFAPHLHFEYRDGKSVPLNPLTMAFELEDQMTPFARELAVIPLSQSAMINASPLIQTFPLFRDKGGVYHFADTISVFGEFGFAMNAVDKREGTNNIYQFHRIELLVDGKLEFELNYDQIPFKQGKFAKTMIQYDLKRQNLGEFQKLYRLPEHKKISLHVSETSGILGLAPGVHSIEIHILDAKGNKTIVKGTVAATFPMTLEANEIFRDDKVIILALAPKRGGLSIRDAVIYNFTKYGFTDQKVEILHSEQVKKDLHVTLPLRSIKDRVLQIIGINQLGGMIDPYHWTDVKPEISVVDVHPELKISNTQRGLFFQVDIDHYVPAKVTMRLANDNTFMSYPMNQIGPNTFLTEKLSHNIVNNMTYVDIELQNEDLSRETRFHYLMQFVSPGEEYFAFSNDRDCSIKTLPGTFFQNSVVWIDKVKEFATVESGFHMSPVYQLQPFDLALKGNFQVGIRYERDLAEHSNLGIYYFDPKSEKWTYVETINNKRKQILTAELDRMDAVTVIQDLDSPKIKSTFPGNGGQYHLGDIDKIVIKVDDLISGIAPEEDSFDLLFNDDILYPAYQPIKKTITYNFDQPLQKGPHKIEFKVQDRMGNESNETIYFSIY